MEGVLAAFAQFDNDVRAIARASAMTAALELGRWVFLAPIGYLNAPRSIGKSLIHDPERAPLVRRAFEEYATSRYTKEQLLKRAKSMGPHVDESLVFGHPNATATSAPQHWNTRHAETVRTRRTDGSLCDPQWRQLLAGSAMHVAIERKCGVNSGPWLAEP